MNGPMEDAVKEALIDSLDGKAMNYEDGLDAQLDHEFYMVEVVCADDMESEQ